MAGRIVKVVLICTAVIALGVSIRTLVSNGTFSCAAEDLVQEAPVAPAIDRESAPAESQPPAEGVPGVSTAPADEGYDFSDASSWNLTVTAWEHLAGRDYKGVYTYAKKCIELHEPAAREMAATMRRFAAPGHEDDFALVNDVAAAHYVMGEAYMKEGKYDEAVREFTYVMDAYPFAQCWDPKGWFWKVSEISRKNIEKIEKLKKEADARSAT